MRKGETSKIRVKKKFAFGRPGEVEALKFPQGYSTKEVDSERRKKLLSKGVIYELTLVDFIVRRDMEANGNYYKQVWTKPKRNEYEFPNTDLDEVIYSLKCF